jgi:hypothetical protein
MLIMGTRLETIDQTIQGYQQTGVPLIYFNGEGLGPIGPYTTGIYYFIPLLARLFDLNAQQAGTNQPANQEYVFWHHVYIGFGYLNNPLGIKYKDEMAIDKVHSISPDTEIYSKEYQEILKEEVFKLIQSQKYFVFHTVFSKIGVMLFFFIYSANLGLIAAYYYPKKRALESAFLVAILFSTAPGILVMPYRRYILGYMALSIFYGLVSLNEAVEQGALSRIKAGLLSWKKQN